MPSRVTGEAHCFQSGERTVVFLTPLTVTLGAELSQIFAAN